MARVDLEKLAELEKAATPGKWECYEQRYKDKYLIGVRAGQRLFDYVQATYSKLSPAREDLKLCVFLRNNAKQIIRELEAAREVVLAAKEGMKFALDPSTPRFDCFMAGSLNKYDEVCK